MSTRQPPDSPTRPKVRPRPPTNWTPPRLPPYHGSTPRWELDLRSRARRPGPVTPSPTAPRDPRQGADHPWPA
eukprot:4540515-Pleurochrysis_carterae.AAC.1